MTQVPAVQHRVTIPDLWNAGILDYENTGHSPTRKAVCLLLAQILVESGGYPWCWNLTNIKRSKSWTGDWCAFECGEEIKASTLASIEALGPGLVRVVAQYTKGGEPWRSIKIKPPHPWSHFRAYPDLRAGIAGKFAYLRSHPAVLSALETGDVATFNDALAAARFYTASKKKYLDALNFRLAQVQKETELLDWGDVI